MLPEYSTPGRVWRPNRIIFERGLELSEGLNSLPLLRDIEFYTYNSLMNEIKNRFNVRPVVLIDSPFGDTLDYYELLWRDNIHPPGIRFPGVADQYSLSPRAQGDNESIYKIQYICNSLVYHCRRLAETYCDHMRWAHIYGMRDSAEESEMSGIAGPSYFEFDALVTKARTAYDLFSFLLWRWFTPARTGNKPDNFIKTVRHLVKKDMLPERYRSRLCDSWERYGTRLTEYRDSVVHWTPVDRSYLNVRFTKIPQSVWMCRILIPDNPEAKSMARFTYNYKIDALYYSWLVTCEIISLFRLFLHDPPFPTR